MNRSAEPCRIVFLAPGVTDRELASGIAEALRGVPRVKIEATTSFEGAHSLLNSSRIALLLVHISSRVEVSRAAALVQAANGLPEPVKTVVLGEPGQTRAGLELLKVGAADYLERPLDLRRLALLADVLTIRTRLENARSAPAPTRPQEDDSFVSDLAGPMVRALDQVRRVATTDSTILLQGETGTGKTHLARKIHNLSPRRSLPLLIVNCAALSPNLIESEIFGHVRGAYTGADRDRTGKFAEAAGGTLVLDEIDSLPIELQAKLLRVVEERVFEPVGSNLSQPMQARLIATANRPLGREVAIGRFRSDLYYRLSVVTFELPPLRDRREVLPALIERFVRKFGDHADRPISGVDPAAMAALTAYRWPGNIRELRNVIERAVALLPGGVITLADLPDAVRVVLPDETREVAAIVDTAEVPSLGAMAEPRAADSGTSLAATAAAAEAMRIADALRRNNNNRRRTAAELGISRETLYKKMHRYGLFDPVGRLRPPPDNTRRGNR